MEKILLMLLSTVIAMADVNAASVFTAVCGKMAGADVTQDAVAPASKVAGTTFQVNAEEPGVLIGTWPSELPEITNKKDVVRSKIIDFSGNRLRAIDFDNFGLYTYSFDLTHGTLLYAMQRQSSLVDGKPSIVALSSKCVISR